MSKFDQYPVARLFTAPRPRTGEQHTLHIDTPSSLTEIFVIDDGFNLVGRGQRRLELRLDPGEYLVKLRTGDSYEENWVSLQSDQIVRPAEGPLPPTVAPIAERAGWSFDESRFAEELRRRCSLSVVVREPNGPAVADDLRIRRTDDTTLARLDAPVAGGPWEFGQQGGVAGMGATVPPGGYLVMVSARGLRPYLMPLWVAPGCSTQLFLERRTLGVRGRRRRGPHLESASLYIGGPDAPWEESKHLLALADAAKAVLTYDRPLLPTPEEIALSLDENRRSPLVGLLAAHLLRLRWEEAHEPEVGDRLRSAIDVLTRLLPGSPDVGALALALEMPADAEFDQPPLLAHSWAILQGRRVIPAGSYADRIRPAVCATRPWLVWNRARMIENLATVATRAGIRAIRKTLHAAESELPAAWRDAAGQLGKHLQVVLGPDGKVSIRRR